MIRTLLTTSRYLVLAAVFGSLVAALALFAYGVIETVVVIADTVAHADVSSKGGKALALAFIEIVDLFLLGTVLLMIALGFYELFIDSELPLPEWTVTELLLPVVVPETLPPPAVTVLDIVPEGARSPGFKCTTLQLPGLSTDLPADCAAAGVAMPRQTMLKIVTADFMMASSHVP